MDALTRVSYYFPAQSLTSFWILSNLIMSNAACTESTRGLMIAVIVFFCIFVLSAGFTDTYTASNNIKYMVVLIPLHGPVCFSLPTDFDKDRVYDHFYLKIRDYIRALLAMVTFLLIVIFITPISVCLMPADSNPNISSLDPAVVRTLPIVFAVLSALMFMCLGNPRQCIGFQNVEETCPGMESKMGNNPIYAGERGAGGSSQQYPGPAPSIPEGDEDDYNEPPPYSNQGHPSNSYPPHSSQASLPKQGSQGASQRDDRYDSRQGRASNGMGPPQQSVRHSRSPEPPLRLSNRSERMDEDSRA
ncbi:hypothetical protein FOA52_003068 [Chlamydomonas sp. UWO 241]|nr:hypothetical protein FOA52_003068 [Chlamydomonas sp. UWO 241]